MKKTELERVNEILMKLTIIEQYDEAFDRFKKLTSGEIREVDDDGEPIDLTYRYPDGFNAKVLAADRGLTLPYSYLEKSLHNYRNDIAAEVKKLGYDGPEADVAADAPENPPRSADEYRIVRVPDAAFPFHWDRGYYAARLITDKDLAPCGVCGGEGQVFVERSDGAGKYRCSCPSCEGRGLGEEVILHRYCVDEYKLDDVHIDKDGMRYAMLFRGVTISLCYRLGNDINIGLCPRTSYDARDLEASMLFETREEAEEVCKKRNAVLKTEGKYI
jgi:hypothetical protein